MATLSKSSRFYLMVSIIGAVSCAALSIALSYSWINIGLFTVAGSGGAFLACIMYEKVNVLLDRINKGFKHIEKTLENLEGASKELRDMRKKIDDEMLPKVDELLKNAVEASKDAGSVIKKIDATLTSASNVASVPIQAAKGASATLTDMYTFADQILNPDYDDVDDDAHSEVNYNSATKQGSDGAIMPNKIPENTKPTKDNLSSSPTSNQGWGLLSLFKILSTHPDEQSESHSNDGSSSEYLHISRSDSISESGENPLPLITGLSLHNPSAPLAQIDEEAKQDAKQETKTLSLSQ